MRQGKERRWQECIMLCNQSMSRDGGPVVVARMRALDRFIVKRVQKLP